MTPFESLVLQELAAIKLQISAMMPPPIPATKAPVPGSFMARLQQTIDAGNKKDAKKSGGLPK